ncbi:MAG: MBL fold metallo-hydrolase [Pseudomonadota bacterium]
MPNLDRREFVLSASAVAAATGLSGPMLWVEPASARTLPEKGKGFSSAKIGDAELVTLFDGIWQKKHDENFIRNAGVDETKAALKKGGLSTEFVPITFTIPAVKMRGKTIMFDAGTGAQLAPTAGLLDENMKGAGIEKGKVDTIIVTHFHPDHIFGLMQKGSTEQVYPDAEIIVPAAELKFWTDDATIAKLPKRRQGLAQRIKGSLGTWKNVRPIEPGAEVAPGITAVAAHGHTPGHTVFRIASGSDQAMVLADTSNVPALFVQNPEWQAVFDMAPDEAIATRKKLYDMAIADGITVTGYHFGFPGHGKIEKDGSGYAFVAG